MNLSLDYPTIITNVRKADNNRAQTKSTNARKADHNSAQTKCGVTMESALMRPAPSWLAARRRSFAGILTTHLGIGHNFHVQVPTSSLDLRSSGGLHGWAEPVVAGALCRCRATSGGATESSSDGGRDYNRGGAVRELVVSAGEVLSMAYPVWIALACVLGLWRPSTFSWVDQKWQIIGLTVAMLGMGMTMTLDDMKGAMLMSKELLIGFLLQYTVMPLSALFVSKLLRLPSHYAAGLILVGCCPGGTASNIITYLARGNVALSVLMTTASTISAVVMTPFLTSKLAGQFVAVDPVGLFTSTVQIVLAPVLVGAALNQYCNTFVGLVSPLMPLVAVTTSATLCGSVIAQNAPSILSSGVVVVIASCSLHTLGFFLGYVIPSMLRVDVSSSRTISIEVGMQNAVLGLVLAARHFGNPLTAVPSAVSSLCHLICGSILVGIWRCISSSTNSRE